MVQSWTQFRCIAERSRYLLAARRLMAALERSGERKIDSSDLERFDTRHKWLPWISHGSELFAYDSCHALLFAMEAQHGSAYVMRWHRS
jgi:hypothetical protein